MQHHLKNFYTKLVFKKFGKMSQLILQFRKNKNIFKKSAQKYLDDCNYNEYFISGVYNIMIKENMKIKYFLTDLHISFGTPEEYKEVQNYNFKELL